MPPLLMGRLLFVENHHEGAGAFVVVGNELDVVVIVERYVNEQL